MDGYLPWSGIAMRPSAVNALLEEVVLHDRTRIVECGGGLSSLFLARLAHERGARLFTLEQDPDWADRLERELETERQAGTVEIVRAPLVEGPSAFGPWYAEEPLAAVGDDPIDLLVVDGPIAGERYPEIRYHALPHFRDQLAPGACIVLDDILRRGERRIARRWESEFGIPFELRPLAGDIAIGYVP
jgi:predicted O-methyltransferase YrrM